MFMSESDASGSRVASRMIQHTSRLGLKIARNSILSHETKYFLFLLISVHRHGNTVGIERSP